MNGNSRDMPDFIIYLGGFISGIPTKSFIRASDLIKLNNKVQLRNVKCEMFHKESVYRVDLSVASNNNILHKVLQQFLNDALHRI